MDSMIKSLPVGLPAEGIRRGLSGTARRLGLVVLLAAGFTVDFGLRQAPAAAPYPQFALVFTETEWREMKECLIQQGRLEIIRQLKPDAHY